MLDRSNPNNPDFREPELCGCTFDFRDDGVELFAIPGVTVRGRAEIEIDQFNQWFVWKIFTGDDHSLVELPNTSPLFSMIVYALEGREGDRISEQCVEAAKEW